MMTLGISFDKWELNILILLFFHWKINSFLWIFKKI